MNYPTKFLLGLAEVLEASHTQANMKGGTYSGNRHDAAFAKVKELVMMAPLLR